MSGHRCRPEKLHQTSSCNSSSKLHTGWLMLCSTSNGILAEHHCFINKFWSGFAHVNKFFPLIKNIISLSSPLVKPAIYGLALGGAFFPWGCTIFMLVLNGTFKLFHETSGSFVHLSFLPFLFPNKKREQPSSTVEDSLIHLVWGNCRD